MPFVLRFSFAILIVLLVGAATPRSGWPSAEQTTIEVFRNAAASVVHVAVENRTNRKRAEKANATGEYGTGFIWDSAGDIVTNSHLVGEATEIAVVLSSGKLEQAKLIGIARYYDLAVLRTSETKLPPLTLGRSDDLQVGQSVFAIGNPFGYDQTLTTGVVSALKRRVMVNGDHEIADTIQTDAAINPGNSGGPLLNSRGALIGVNTSIISPSGTSSGIGFAIPVATIKRVVPALIATGHAPFLGIGIIVAPRAVSVLSHFAGLAIQRLLPGGPAEQAGLKDAANGHEPDVIEAVDGQQVRRLADLSEAVSRAGVGGRVRLTVFRNAHDFEITLPVVDEAADLPSKGSAPEGASVPKSN